MMFAVTEQSRGESRFLNFFLFGDSWFIQRQVEERDGALFMRAKKRVVQ